MRQRLPSSPADEKLSLADVPSFRWKRPALQSSCSKVFHYLQSCATLSFHDDDSVYHNLKWSNKVKKWLWRTALFFLLGFLVYGAWLIDRNLLRPEQYEWYVPRVATRAVDRLGIQFDTVALQHFFSWKEFYGESPRCENVLSDEGDFVFFENETFLQTMPFDDLVRICQYAMQTFHLAFVTPRMLFNMTKAGSHPPCLCIITLDEHTEIMIQPIVVARNDSIIGTLRTASLIIHEDRLEAREPVPASVTVQYRNQSSDALEIQLYAANALRFLHCSRYMGTVFFP